VCTGQIKISKLINIYSHRRVYIVTETSMHMYVYMYYKITLFTKTTYYPNLIFFLTGEESIFVTKNAYLRFHRVIYYKLIK